MKTSDRLRHSLLLAALVATVAAANWVGNEEATALLPVSQPVAQTAELRVPPPTAATAVTEPVEVEKLQQRSVSREFGDMFPSRSWQPPPSPPAKSAPPRAPPLPFAFLGRMVEDGKTVVFLTRQDQVFTVTAGDTVAGNYRIEEVGTETVVITYLPLQERQVLNIGAIN